MPDRSKLVASKIVAVFRAASLKAEHGADANVSWKDFSEFEDVYEAGLIVPNFCANLNEWPDDIMPGIVAMQVMNFYFVYNYGVGPMTLRHLANHMFQQRDANTDMDNLGRLICQLASKPVSEMGYIEDFLVEQCDEVYKAVAPTMPRI